MKTALPEFKLPEYNRTVQLKQKTALSAQQHQNITVKLKQRTTLPTQHQRQAFQMEKSFAILNLRPETTTVVVNFSSV